MCESRPPTLREGSAKACDASVDIYTAVSGEGGGTLGETSYTSVECPRGTVQ